MVVRTVCVNVFLLAAVLALPLAHGQAPLEASCPTPEWPTEARRYEIEGVTTVRYAVGADGKAVSAVIAQSSGWKILDDAALGNVASCKFFKPTAPGELRPTRYNWTLRGATRVHPLPIPGSCQASARFGEFRPGDKSASDASGIVLRMLIGGEGKPFGVFAERKELGTALVRDAIAYMQTCRFAVAPDAVRMPSDTLFGKLSIN